MKPNLAGCVMKLSRAEHHRKKLVGLFADFYAKPNLYGLVPDHKRIESYPDGIRVGMKVTNRPRAFPREMSVVLGDYVQNLRAVLDHLAYQLAVAHLRRALLPDEMRWSEFPITDRSSKYAAWLTQAKKVRLSMFSDDTRASFCRLQPHHGGRDPLTHPLWWLATLSNTDKHRLLLLMVPTAEHRIVVRDRRGFKKARVQGSVRGTKIGLDLPHAGAQGDQMQVGVDTSTDVILRDAQMAFIGNPMKALADARRFMYRYVFPEFEGAAGKLPRVR